MDNIDIETIVEGLGFLKSIKDAATELEKEGKTEVKDKNISATTSTGIINTYIQKKTDKVYTSENQKKIDKIKRNASEAIAKIPYTEIEVKTSATRITPTTIVDDEVILILKVLLNPYTKDKAIEALNQLLK